MSDMSDDYWDAPYEYCHNCDNAINEGDASVIEHLEEPMLYADEGADYVAVCADCYDDYVTRHPEQQV